MNNPTQSSAHIVKEKDVRFLELRPEIQEDPRKIRVYVKKHISQQFPDIELDIRDNQNKLLAETAMITVFQEGFVITLHLPDLADISFPLCLRGKIIFEEPIGMVDQKTVTINV